MENQKYSLRFPKRFRLLKRSEYLSVQTGEAVFRCQYFVILKKQSALPHPRFGVTVSKRIGGAAKRNRARRLIKEAIRLNRLSFKSGDYVFIGMRGIDSAPFSEIARAVKEYLNRNL